MSSEVELLQCYNKGCGQKFKEDENNDGACIYHPGSPVFHDAMKGWSCCKKRSTDFTDFLNMPGCVTGRHNSVKPEEPEKAPVEPLKAGEEIIVKGPLPPKLLEDMTRPPDDLPYAMLSVKVLTSLKNVLEKHAKQQLQEKNDMKETEEANDDQEEEEPPLGTACKNKSCSAVYVGPDTNITSCQHHPGIAIFHDGYKYWSCCRRRTSDFNEFQRQEGCTQGDHVWFKKKCESCRYDWHQTGSMVIVTVYAKACNPEKSVVKANPTNVSVKLVYDHGEGEFENNINLFGVIDVARSRVDMMANIVEIKMRKAEPINWSHLFFAPPNLV